MKIPPIQHFENNPRQITEKQFKRLQETMDEFGDLSGIVINLKQQGKNEVSELIGGNQRSEAGQFINGQPVITEEFKKPLKDGTVALGYFELNGKRFNCRIVRWDEDKALRANIIANAAGGTWDWDTLANVLPEVLQDSGFDVEMLKGMSIAIGSLHELIASKGDFDKIQTLDEIQKQYGESQDDDFYPTVEIKVSPEIKQRFDNLMDQIDGTNEMEKFDVLISCYERTIQG